MNKEQELKNKIAKDQMKYVIKLMEMAKEKGREEAREEFSNKLEQLKKDFVGFLIEYAYNRHYKNKTMKNIQRDFKEKIEELKEK